LDNLYNEKIGLYQPKDISENQNVIYGSKAELHIRELFALEHSGVFLVEHFPFDILANSTFTDIGATLDGELTYLGTDKKWKSTTGYMGLIKHMDKGVYEVKTTHLNNKVDMWKWTDQIPDYYFAQHCTQLFCSEYPFGIVDARILLDTYKKVDGSWEKEEFPLIQTFRYLYFREDPLVWESMKYVASCVLRTKIKIDERVRPGLIIKPYRK
jgi:hypothetical protein